MAFANPNKHSWKEYRYKFANDNKEPMRMWIRDDERIFEVDIDTFVTGNTTAWHEGHYKSYQEAVDKMDAAND